MVDQVNVLNLGLRVVYPFVRVAFKILGSNLLHDSYVPFPKKYLNSEISEGVPKSMTSMRYIIIAIFEADLNSQQGPKHATLSPSSQ
jgi:hypothetical protein